MVSVDEVALVDVDLMLEPPCEGWAHPAGSDGHDDGPARFVVRLPGDQCGPLLVCAGRAAVFRRDGVVCHDHNVEVMGADLILVEL